jgi:hypothetical protein
MEKNDKGLVVVLAGALACALLAVAFLLGRISARPAEVAGPAAAPPTAAATASNFAPAPPNFDSTPPDASVNEMPSLPGTSQMAVESPVRSNPSVSVSGSGAVSVASTPGSPPSPERQQIAAYFTQIDRMDDLGAGDPQAFATSMLQSVSSGDYSGFDDLVARSKSQRERLRSLTPPRACLEHHRLALALSGDSVAMLERLRAALAKGDTTALMTMATEGHTLEAQANQLKSMGETIKRQAGL